MSNISPTPWVAAGWKTTLVNDANGVTLCLMPGGNCSLETIQANAHLLAAAPELLEACKEAETVLRWAAQEAAGRVKAGIVGGWLHHADSCRAAIKKATG